MITQDRMPALGHAARAFATTHWSMVLQAGGQALAGREVALNELCRNYWYPLYFFARRRGLAHADAEDLIQSFFAFVVEREVIARADRNRGRFRTFLLAALQNFLANERARGRSEKRGGGRVMLSFDAIAAEERYRHEPATHLSPERLFDRKWAGILLDQVMEIVRREYVAAGKGALLDEASALLWGGDGDVSHADIGRKLKMSEGAVRVAVHRLRVRFKECLRIAVAHTVASEDEIDPEIRHLVSSLEQ